MVCNGKMQKLQPKVQAITQTKICKLWSISTNRAFIDSSQGTSLESLIFCGLLGGVKLVSQQRANWGWRNYCDKLVDQWRQITGSSVGPNPKSTNFGAEFNQRKSNGGSQSRNSRQSPVERKTARPARHLTSPFGYRFVFGGAAGSLLRMHTHSRYGHWKCVYVFSCFGQFYTQDCAPAFHIKGRRDNKFQRLIVSYSSMINTRASGPLHKHECLEAKKLNGRFNGPGRPLISN